MARLLASLGLFIRVNAFFFLLLCYLLFILLGAIVFSAVEQPMEEELRAEVEEVWSSFLRENPCVEEEKLKDVLRGTLSAYQRDVPVLKEEEEEGHSGFTSSLYFVIVTLTTMGSDSYTPKSDEAKLFCIFYCTLGIPLTLFLLTLSSNLLLPILTHAPIHYLHTLWGLPHAQAALLHAVFLFLLVLCLLFLVPALLVFLLEPNWSFLDSLFFCFLTLSTVGQGGDALGRTWSSGAKETLELLTTCYLVVGLVVLLTCKDTLLQVPQVCAVLRLLSGPQYSELEGFHLNELTLNDCEEEPQYSQSICTISSTPLHLSGPSPDNQTTDIDLHRTRTTADKTS
ncbi:potassium channel subfamily K member 1 [Xyrichtys novacula]|uniref:Potassium channel subfamily K member 1 n=1 Tax=Xyrichtys novacula TaxID=13765 RepID=A0AAV1HKU5_XYRNO|nr:potassium channel subfamily K member 1 [Xyrichtys novacula]